MRKSTTFTTAQVSADMHAALLYALSLQL